MPYELFVRHFLEDYMKNERTDCNTELLYETDAYTTIFRAEVIGVKEEGDFLFVELNETAFFPEGGGQASDRGILGGFPVMDVQKKDGHVYHYVKRRKADSEILQNTFRVGEHVSGEVDFALRFRRMQMHLAEHLFCGIAHRKFGYDNVGFHLSDVVTFDLDGALSEEDIAEIEKECNRAVWKNVSVKVHFPTPEEAENMPFRSKLELSEGLRLVEIEGYDLCACCAPALKTTGEIGAVKVIDSMPHRGGTRLTLIAGEAAYEDYRMLNEEQKNLTKLFSSVRGETTRFAEVFLEKSKALHEENKELKKRLTEFYVQNLKARIAGAKEAGKNLVVMIFPEADEVQSREMINACVREYDGIIGIFRKNDAGSFNYVFGRLNASEEKSLRNLAGEIKEALGGRGGGSEVMIQGSVTASEKEIQSYFHEN